LGAQVVRTNTDLLHFHSTPSALESSTGGVDPIGIKIAVQSTKNTTKSKEIFIAVIPISVKRRLGQGGVFLCD